MSFDLYAFVSVPRYSTDETGAPRFQSAVSDYRRVFVANFNDKKKLLKGMNKEPIYLDAEKTILVPTTGVHLYEIVEVP